MHSLLAKKPVRWMTIRGNVNKKAALWWLAAILWMGAIFVLSAIPSITTPFDEPAYDFTFKKFAHVTVYGILTALLFGALRIHIKHQVYALLTAILVSVLYGCSDEWHQTFVPGRKGTLRDVAIDGVGAIVASVWLRSKQSAVSR
jgi:VanZ family protein